MRPLSFTVLAALVAACSPDALPADAGMETSSCLEGACLGELECLSDLCVAPEGATDGDDGGGDAAGDDGTNPGSDGGTPGSGGSTPGSGGGDSDSDSDDPNGAGACSLAAHTPCDSGSPTIAQALGACDGSVTASAEGAPEAIGLRVGLGGTQRWAPTEGAAFVAIGSGMVVDLDLETPPGDNNASPTHCSDDTGSPEIGTALPEPMQASSVAGDCENNPSLVGTGDCSGSLQTAFDQGQFVSDFTAIRVETTVPDGVRSFSYDYAFFTTEYPAYTDGTYNDMHIAWLESEAWTGNIAFDGDGNPISASTGFLEVLDDDATSQAFEGTCMRGHGGTEWIRASAPVVAGEDIVLVLAIFDMGDAIVDSYAFLDNFSWSCDDLGRPINIKVKGS